MTECFDPLEMIDLLFARLGATYGLAFERAMGHAPINEVKSAWADTLSGFLQNRKSMQSIKWALQNLPDVVPNAPTFRTLCRMAPAEKLPALPLPQASPEVVAEVKEALVLLSSAPKGGMRDWAYRLKARDEAGEKLNRNQIRCYQSALGMTP